MAVELPTVVVEAHAENAPRPLSSLDEAARRALTAHGHETGLIAIELPEQQKPTTIPLDPERSARIARVEETLHAVRGPLDLGDKDALPALRVRVAAAYAETRAHPEDPEAPFLLGEALRTLARIEDIAGDASGARALRVRADLIDGGRRVGLSEGGPFEPTKAAAIEITVKWIDATASTALFVDGEPRDAKKPLSLQAGEHHVRVVAAGVTLHAQWITLASAGELTLRGGAPITACALNDVQPALASLDGFHIACARWMRVERHKDSIEVRVCSSTSCGPSSVWSTVPIAPTKAPPPTTSIWSSRWTWVGIGAAAVVGGSIAAWRLGAFDRGESPPPVWRWEGAR